MRSYHFLLIAILSTVFPLGVQANELRVGTAEVEITPPLQGSFQETHDPLKAKAIVFEQGETRAALVLCDLIGVPYSITSAARAQTEQRTGIPASNIVIAATHAHTSRRDDAEILIEKLVDVIDRAKASAQAARLSSGVVEQTPPLTFNRRFHMKQGPVRFNPGFQNPGIVRTAGPVDPEVGLLLVQDQEQEKPLAVLTVFALHLDTWGGYPNYTFYSADYPYYLEQVLRQQFSDEFMSLFGAGTCGDLNHFDVTQPGPRPTEEIGTMLAKTVLETIPELEPVSEPTLAVRSTTIQVPLQDPDPASIIGTPQDVDQITTSDQPFLERVHRRKFERLRRMESPTYPVEVQAFRLSPDLAIVTLPGEVFVALGLAIKEASPFATTLVVELANDSGPSYIPTEKAFTEGSYETINSILQPGGGEMMVEAALELLRDLADE